MLEPFSKIQCIIEFYSLQNKYYKYNENNLSAHLSHLAYIFVFCLQWMLPWWGLGVPIWTIHNVLADVT